MSNFSQFATFDVKVGGITFTMLRRHTALMLQIGSPEQVFGAISALSPRVGETIAEDDVKALHAAQSAQAKMEDAVLEHALVKVDGVPVEELECTWSAYRPAASALLMAFIKSGLKADPMPNSCKVPAESRQ